MPYVRDPEGRRWMILDTGLRSAPVGSSPSDLTRCSLTLTLEGDPTQRFSVELYEDWPTLENDELWQRIAQARDALA
jgi:hypothetical protein